MVEEAVKAEGVGKEDEEEAVNGVGVRTEVAAGALRLEREHQHETLPSMGRFVRM